MMAEKDYKRQQISKEQVQKGMQALQVEEEIEEKDFFDEMRHALTDGSLVDQD